MHSFIDMKLFPWKWVSLQASIVSIAEQMGERGAGKQVRHTSIMVRI